MFWEQKSKSFHHFSFNVQGSNFEALFDHLKSSKVFLCEYDEADVWEYLMDHLHHSGLVCESSLLE